MNSPITIIFDPPEFAFVQQVDTWGGKELRIVINTDILLALTWIREYQEQLQKESEARANNPALASCYEDYRTMLKLVS